MGELAHASVPDLKETEGGIRDATVLKALVATWLVDVPHVELERSRLAMLDVRDRVHGAGRPGHGPDHPGDVERPGAACWTSPDARAAQVAVRELGRRITHLSRLTWRRVDDALDRADRRRARPSLTPVAEGVALAAGEIVLDKRARPAEDPALLLRAAAAAAERDVVLAPPTAARLARECAPLPDAVAGRGPRPARPAARGRPRAARHLGDAGGDRRARRLLPEWERIRLLPHASEIHRFTVDRHVVETCIEASALIRRVDRPDVLMVAALLHDIGKGSLTEHSVAGEPLARAIATRMGFDADGVELIALLVRWHLLLAETATTRDPDDPATVQAVAERVGTRQALDLLTVLTEADARAASPKAWSSWRSGLILDLSRRTAAALSSGRRPAAGRVRGGRDPGRRRGREPPRSRSRTSATAAGSPSSRPDRVGLLADVSAVLRAAAGPGPRGAGLVPGRLRRLGVGGRRGAAPGGHPAADVRRRWSRAGSTRRRGCGPPRRRCCRRRSTSGPRRRRRRPCSRCGPTDRPGVVHLVCAALAELDVTVRSAHVDTLGPQAVDVFYVQEASAGVLSDQRAAAAAHAVRAALGRGLLTVARIRTVSMRDRRVLVVGRRRHLALVLLGLQVAVGPGPGRVEDVDEAAQRVGRATAHAVVRGQHPVPGPRQEHQHRRRPRPRTPSASTPRG